jgi:hypothetical protein
MYVAEVIRWIVYPVDICPQCSQHISLDSIEVVGRGFTPIKCECGYFGKVSIRVEPMYFEMIRGRAENAKASHY